MTAPVKISKSVTKESTFLVKLKHQYEKFMLKNAIIEISTFYGHNLSHII